MFAFFHWPGPFSGPFRWRVNSAQHLRNMGLHQAADAMWEITEESKRAYHDKQARKAEIRAKRRRTLTGRILNILGL